MRKWILLAVASTALLAAAAALLLVRRLNSYIDDNRFRMARQIGVSLGRTVTLDDLSVSLAGGLGVQIGKLRIGDDPEFSEGEFAAVDRVSVQVRLLPALVGRFEIATVTLDAPEISVIRDAAGFNFDSFGKPISTEPPPRRERKSPPLTIAAPKVAKLRIQNARIRYVDRRTTPPSAIAVDGLDVDAADLGADGPATITVAAALFGAKEKNLEISGSIGPLAEGFDPSRFRVDLAVDLGPIALDDLRRWEVIGSLLPADLTSAEPIELRVSGKGTLERAALEGRIDASNAAVRYGGAIDKPPGVPLRLTFRVARKGTAVTVERAKLEAGDLVATAQGRITASAAPNVDLDLEIPAAPLAAWAKVVPALAGLELGGRAEARIHASGPMWERLPFLKGTVALRDVAIGATRSMPSVEGLTASIALDGDSIVLPDTSFALGGSQVTVRATGRNLARPTVELEGRAAEIRPRALGLSTGDQADALRDVRFEGEARLDAADAKATLNSAAGRILGAEYEDLRAELGLGGDGVALEAARFRAFGGSIELKPRRSGGPGAPPLDLHISAADAAVGALLASLMPSAPPALDGRLRAELDVRGAGQTEGEPDWPSIRENLAGSGSVAVEDGVLKDVALARDALNGLTKYGGLLALVSPELIDKYARLFASDTRFDELTGTVSIAGPRINATEVAMRTPDFAVRGAGSFDAEAGIAFKGKLVLSAELTEDIASEVRQLRYLTNDARRLEIPFSLRGDLPGARAEPEAEAITRALRRALLERGSNGLIIGKGDLADQLDAVLRQLFGE